MSSSPVTPSAPIAHPAPPTTTKSETIVQKIEKDYDWVKLHIILLIITIGLLYGGVSLTIRSVDKLIADHDAATAAAQLKQEGVDTSTQQALLGQLQNLEQQSAARDAQQTALIQTLVQQMSSSRAATAKQVQVDSTADAASTASRLATQTKASPADVTASNTAVTLSLPVARTVTSDLDLLTQSQADVTNLQGQIQAQTTLTTDAKAQLSTAQQTINADKVELVQTVQSDNAACDVKINNAVSAQQTKDSKHNKIWGTLIFIAGALAGHGV